jgi:hypothetical protein
VVETVSTLLAIVASVVGGGYWVFGLYSDLKADGALLKAELKHELQRGFESLRLENRHLDDNYRNHGERIAIVEASSHCADSRPN